MLHPAVDYTPVPSIGYKPPTTYDYRSIRQYKQRTTDSDRGRPMFIYNTHNTLGEDFFINIS